MGLKVYVYDMPSLFNKGVVEKDMRCLSHMFATEIRIHLSLLSSYVRTLDPNEANWFYTPVYTACDLTPQTGLPLIDDMPYMMKSAIEYISTHWPYWNKTNGADHFFVVPHDYGACFHFQVLLCMHFSTKFILFCLSLLENFSTFLSLAFSIQF